MTASWPVGLSQYVNVDSYQEAPENNVTEFQPEVGPPKRRRRSAIATIVYEFTIKMASADYDTLVAFYRDTLLDGALTFTRNLPRDPTGGSGTFEFMFVAAPMYKAIDPSYGDVQIVLRKMP